MTRRTWMLSLLAALAAFALPSMALAQDADLAALRERFRARFPKLLEAQDQGKVGETWDGLVAAVNGQRLEDEQQRLVTEENNDRRELYRILARQENTTPDKVAARNRERNFRTAKPEHYLQTREGRWVQKKDMPRE